MNASRLAALVEDPQISLPRGGAPDTLRGLIATRSHLIKRIAKLDAKIKRRAREDEAARHLMTIPGIGPMIVTAIVA